jgi:hypothetical protein
MNLSIYGCNTSHNFWSLRLRIGVVPQISLATNIPSTNFPVLYKSIILPLWSPIYWLHCQINTIQKSLKVINYRHCHTVLLQGRRSVVHFTESRLHASWSGGSQRYSIINDLYSNYCDTVGQKWLRTSSPYKRALVLFLNVEPQIGQITVCGTFTGSWATWKTWTFRFFLFLLLGEDGTSWLKGWRFYLYSRGLRLKLRPEQRASLMDFTSTYISSSTYSWESRRQLLLYPLQFITHSTIPRYSM